MREGFTLREGHHERIHACASLSQCFPCTAQGTVFVSTRPWCSVSSKQQMPMREQTKNGDGTTFGFGQQLMRLFVYQKTYIYINTYLKSITQWQISTYIHGQIYLYSMYQQLKLDPRLSKGRCALRVDSSQGRQTLKVDCWSCVTS